MKRTLVTYLTGTELKMWPPESPKRLTLQLQDRTLWMCVVTESIRTEDQYS
ncbi:hypothetical protein BgiBS90_012012, partial [Biomphalaria glabrata]